MARRSMLAAIVAGLLAVAIFLAVSSSVQSFVGKPSQHLRSEVSVNLFDPNWRPSDKQVLGVEKDPGARFDYSEYESNSSGTVVAGSLLLLALLVFKSGIVGGS
eukprot:TRINITY_DN1708_c0_g1_i2.p1 TRINITY_DN1708_c0_g1~~TRINITY_DN1708_c0_g1_i2.p1  ORF type:complete len:104 (+),score=18.94 TRINITY_DN1708_c0_g1_i2:73-384(+)